MVKTQKLIRLIFDFIDVRRGETFHCGCNVIGTKSYRKNALKGYPCVIMIENILKMYI